MDIQLRAVCKQYQLGQTSVHALQGIDLEVKQGEFLVLTGPSGSGKSSLLQILGALDKPTSGEVWMSRDEGAKWSCLARHLPEIYAVETALLR